jgi:hypothetical protein
MAVKRLSTRALGISITCADFTSILRSGARRVYQGRCPDWVDAVDKVGDEVANALVCVLWMGWSPFQSGERRDRSDD